jgi:hypothetical protein
LGGSDNDYSWGIAVDTSSNAYVAGSTGSTDFPTQNPYQRYNAGDNDVFVAKLSPSGSSLIYSTYLGGSAYDEAFGIKVDSAGSTYVAGYTYSTNFPTQHAYQGYFRGNGDAFVAKLSPSGNGLVYSTYLGGGNLDCANAIAVDSSGSAYVAGLTSSYDFPTQNPYQRYYSGIYDAFVAKLTPGHWLTVQKSGFGSVTSDPPGINCDPYCNEEFLKDHTITLTATAEPFSTFVGWSGGGCSGTGTCVVSMVEDVTVTATFHSFTLTIQKTGTGRGKVMSNPPGIDCGSDCSELYGQGQPITLNPTPGLFSAFAGWSGGGCSGEDVCVVSLMENITVTTTFDRSPQEGTIGTQITMNDSGFGTKKGKVLIGSTSTKIITWSPSSITCEVTKPLPPISYSVMLVLKEPKGVDPITIPGAFIMKAPEIVSVDPSGTPGEGKTLSGKFFGSKKPKVYLEDQSTGQKKSCKVTSWSMDPDTGVSNLRFVLPKPKGYVPGVSTTYNLKVTNKVGTAITTFRID